MTGKGRLRAAAVLVAVASFGFAVGGGVVALAARSLQLTTAATPILSGPLAEYKAPSTFPGQGTDSFESIAEFGIRMGCAGQTILGGAAGPTTVKRQPPGDKDSDGKADIQTEIVAMSLTGYVPGVGEVDMRESQARASTGKVEALRASSNFPANSFFDVFFEIDVPSVGTLHNRTAARMSNGKILGIPPIGSEYNGGTVQLYDASDQLIACMTELAHVPEDPSHVLMKREMFGIEAQLDQIYAKLP